MSHDGQQAPAPGAAGQARRRAVRAFYLYRVLSRSYFHLPVLLIWFLEASELSVPVATGLLALYGATLTYGAPVAARLQRRLPPAASIVAGELVKAAGLAVLVGSGGNVVGAGAGQILSGLGYGLAQGPDSLLLRSLHRDDEAEEYGQHESRSMSWVFAAVLVAGIAGGVLYGRAPQLPFWASVGTTLLAALAASRLGAAASKARSPAPVAAGGGASQAVSLQPAERRWIAYYVTMRGLALAAFVGLLPIVFFYELAVDVRLFGVVLGTFSVFAYVSGRYGRTLLAHLPDTVVPTVSILGLAAALALLAAAPNLAVALVGMALLGAVGGVVRPLTMARLGAVARRTPDERGTVIGRMERFYGLANALAIVAGGTVAQVAGVGVALWGFAGVAVLVGLASPGLVRRGRPAGGGTDERQGAVADGDDPRGQ